MASTVATLSWGVYEYRNAYENAGQLDKVLDAIKWGTDYFIRCHTARMNSIIRSAQAARTTPGGPGRDNR